VPQETDAEKIARLERKIVQLELESERLRRQLEEALRAVKPAGTLSAASSGI
jgi:hypothetical protein